MTGEATGGRPPQPTGADSSGQTWSGRTLQSTGFDGDSGAADPALQAALAEPSDEQALMSALSTARLIVPIVAAPAETDTSGPLEVEKSTDMAVVTLTAPDGQRALPVFSSVDALAAWDATARPSPVTSALAAQAAVAERCEVMLLDLGSPGSITVRPSMLWALAQQRPWEPAHVDPVVQQAISRAAQEHDVVDAVTCADGSDVGPGVLRVVLSVRPGLSAARLQQVATGIGEQVATDGEVRARIDGLTFSVRPTAGE